MTKKQQSEIAETVIIGAGACGLMCAVQAGFLGKKVLLLEHNDKVGAKILISGGGRCNYTNLYASSQNYISKNEHFCKSALSQWTVYDSINFFETYGIYGEEKTLGQLFPIDKKAKDIVAIFTNLCKQLGQEIRCNAEVLDVTQTETGFSILYKDAVTNQINAIETPRAIIASGGLPVSKIGASDFALKLARKFNLKIEQTAPALVPLTVTGKHQEWFAQLSGTSVFCSVSNERASFEENILFTHWGLSGPAVLQISSYWKAGESLEIDFLPKQNIREYIERERVHSGKRQLSSLLETFFTKKLTDSFSKFLPISKNLASLAKEDILLIESVLHHFKVKPAGDKGYDKAEVMRGGISTGELSSKTLECKNVKGLFWGGECVDVTGWLGGYNFQWAWASGYVIAQNI